MSGKNEVIRKTFQVNGQTIIIRRAIPSYSPTKRKQIVMFFLSHLPIGYKDVAREALND